MTRHERAVAKISPPEMPPRHLSQIKGWLKNNDSFFQNLSDIIKNRNPHVPRVFK